MGEVSNLETFATEELRRAGLFDKDSDYEGMLADATLRLIQCFATEGHSGFSASMAIRLFERLARFEPLTPLTGEADEWMEVGDNTWQNLRCPRVFKNRDGSAWDIEGKVFRESSGQSYTSIDSNVPVTFPYVPKTEVIDV